MTVTVRRATKDDARVIAQYAIRLFAQHYDYDQRRFARITSVNQAEWFYGGQTAEEKAAVLVAEREGRVVGFAFLEYEARNYANLLDNAVWLHDIFIEETARETGAGRLLIERSIDVAKELGAGRLMLSVAAKNELAQAFFERRGFRTTMFEMMLDLSEEL